MIFEKRGNELSERELCVSLSPVVPKVLGISSMCKFAKFGESRVTQKRSQADATHNTVLLPSF